MPDSTSPINPGLPTRNDSLFRKGDDWWNNACVNFADDGLYLYAYGYKEAADILVNSIVETGQKNDVLLNPIAYCYRHYLELTIKLIFIRCSTLLDHHHAEPKWHRIDHLWVRCVPLIREIFTDNQWLELDELTSLIA